MTITTQPVAITMQDGTLRIMRIITRAPVACFSSDQAVCNGFVLSSDEGFWEGGVTDIGIEMEIARSYRDAEGNPLPVKRWRRISEAEIPKDRKDRDALRDDGKRLTHDPSVRA